MLAAHPSSLPTRRRGGVGRRPPQVVRRTLMLPPFASSCCSSSSSSSSSTRPQQPPVVAVGAGNAGLAAAVRRPPQVVRRRLIARASSSSPSTKPQPPVVIIGAGIAGLAAAVALRRCGVDALVLEAAPELRTEGLALSLWANAWRALEGLEEEGGGSGANGVGGSSSSVAARVRAASGPPLRTFEFASSSGRVLKSFTLREATRERGEPDAAVPSDEFRGVRRADLLKALLAALPEGNVRFGVRGEVVMVSEAPASSSSSSPLPRVRLVPTTTTSSPGGGGRAEEEEIIEARCVVGADSARSTLATGPLLRLAAPRYNGYVAWRGVARGGALPASSADDIVRVALGAGVRAGVYPLGGGDTYWFVTRNAPASALEQRAAGGGGGGGRDGDDDGSGGAKAALRAEALDAVSSWGWRGMRELVEATPAEVLSRARIGDRWTFGGGKGGKGGGKGGEGGEEEGGGVGRGRVTLAGDALHPMSPNLGQGGCTALEDAVVLASALCRAFELEEEKGGRQGVEGGRGDVVARALRAYERERLARTLPLTLRSAAVGFALQLPYPPVVALRDAVIERVFRPAGFLDHTRYDCRVAARRVADEVR